MKNTTMTVILILVGLISIGCAKYTNPETGNTDLRPIVQDADAWVQKHLW